MRGLVSEQTFESLAQITTDPIEVNGALGLKYVTVSGKTHVARLLVPSEIEPEVAA